MKKIDDVKLGKFLSLVLRHKPETIGITLDKNGWADVKELIKKVKLSERYIDMEILERIVRENNKKRYSFNEDKTFEIGLLEEKYFSLEEIKEMFEKNILTTEVKDKFFIKDFAEIEIEKINYFVEKSQNFKEIEDMMKKVCEEETTLELCREAYFEYLADPCDYTKEKLRKAYEAVPEHERIYLGDMDSKDWDYQRILYSDKKREV